MSNAEDASRKPERGVVAPFFPPPARGLAQDWRIDVYDATHERERWQRYMDAANRSYAARGLQAVGEEHVIDVDRYATWFAEAVMVDAGGQELSVGGIRIHMPAADKELLLFEELKGYADIDALRRLLQPLWEQGVCHGGGLWVDSTHGSIGIAADLARACLPIIAATGSQWCIAMTHQHILEAWASLGWLAVSDIPAFAYPDERYMSQVILGGTQSWPESAAVWAAQQHAGASLSGPGRRFAIECMRS